MMPRTIEPVVAAGTMSQVDQPVLELDGHIVIRPWHAGDALHDMHQHAHLLGQADGVR